MVSSSDVECLFLQAVLSRGILSETLAQILWAKCVVAVQAADDSLVIPHSDDAVAWHSFVTRVNNSLNELHLEFRYSEDELTGRKMYTLVNRKDDALAQMASGYSPVEIAYFKAIIEQIMLAPNEAYSVSSLAALREVNALKTTMTKTQAEVVLGSFVAKGWLFKSKRGCYSLSTRTLVELSHYLKDTYPDEIIECTICMELVTRGIACLTANCKTRMHYHCFTPSRVQRAKCPACDKPWPQDASDLVPVGEMAIKEGQDNSRRQVRRISADEDEEDVQNEEFSQPSQSQEMPRTQRSRRGKAKQEKMEVDEDDEDRPPKRYAARRGRHN